MDEYIKREDALDAVLFALCGTGYQSRAIYAIRELPTADVVPKSEVEELSGKYEDLKLKYLDLAKDHDELLAWGGHIKSTERAKIEKAVARKIIADMRELINGYENIDVYLDRIEKKYTEDKE